jgi:hypothetical protein
LFRAPPSRSTARARSSSVRLLRSAGLLALLATILGAPVSNADCDGPFPSFTETSRTATVVVVGDVVGANRLEGGLGWANRFSLHVDRVLRGQSPERLEIRDLPTQPCAGFVVVKIGQRVAIAWDGLAFDPPIRVNAFAIVDGPPSEFIGVESLTSEELLALMPPPDEPAPPAASTDLLGVLLPLGAAILAVGLLVTWRVRATG